MPYQNPYNRPNPHLRWCVLATRVRPVNVPDKGTLFRVRLGPYQSLDDANRIKTALSQNGVGAAIIRATDEAKKP